MKSFIPLQSRRSRNNEPAQEDSDWRGLNLCLGRFVVAQPFHPPGGRLQTACPEQTGRIEGYAALRFGLAASLRAGCLEARDLLKAAWESTSEQSDRLVLVDDDAGQDAGLAARKAQ